MKLIIAIMGGLLFQFRSRSILSYYKSEKRRSASAVFRTIEKQRSIENLAKQETYTGLVTTGSQKRLTRALENLLQVSQYKPFSYTETKKFGLHIVQEQKEAQFKVNFITLTLYSFARRVPGKEAHKQCLEPLLRWLRTKGMTAYVWKAELQSKRKDCHQLHYHLTTDVYIDYELLRDKWNSLQKDAGYLDYFYEKFGHWSPNSTDVHATHNKKNLIGYLKKAIVRYSDKKKYRMMRNKYLVVAELTKADQNKETIEGKIWDCSINLKTSFFEIEAFSDITKKLADACASGEMHKKEFERCTVYELVKTSRDAASYLPYRDRLFYQEHISNMRKYERIKPDIVSNGTNTIIGNALCAKLQPNYGEKLKNLQTSICFN